MMIDWNQTVTTKWANSNRKHFESLGYVYTKNGQEFEVPINDLPTKSHVKVKVICDYCGKEIEKQLAVYHRQHHEELGDACNDCAHIKQQKLCMLKYGVKNPSQVSKFQKKRENTIYERYGCINPSQIDGVTDKKKKTCMKNYGVEVPLQSKEIREKVAKTTLQHGNVPTSSQQIKVYEILSKHYPNCELNKQCSKNILDCVLNINGVLIDVEYDGTYWHQDAQKDRRRDEVVKGYGYKILRIISRRSVPTWEQLKESIDYLLEDDNHTFTRIQLDI